MLDTWFSSALWPFVTLGWPEQTPELRAFYPTDSLSTGRDIIFLWVARMIMMGIEFTDRLPFTDVGIHSIIQAPDSQRMSKSLGTGIDPIDLIEGGPRPPVFQRSGDFPAYGADAVRWGLLAMSSGQDVRFYEEKIAQAHQLTNKLWNASRLVLLGVEGAGPISERRSTRVRSRTAGSCRGSSARGWRSARRSTVRPLQGGAAALRLHLRRALRLVPGAGQAAPARRRPRLAATLLHVLTETVTLAHPLIPFVTEEIYGTSQGRRGLLAARVAGAGGAGRCVRGGEVERAIQAMQAHPRLARCGRCQAGAILPARLPLRATAIRSTTWRGSAGWSCARTVPRPADRLDPDPRRRDRDPPVARTSTSRRRSASAKRVRTARAEIERAEIEARQRRASSPRRRPRSCRPSATSSPRTLAALSGRRWRPRWTPEEAERYLLSLELFGMRFGLDRMRRLMTALGHPERAFDSIHVVGTNGKSSTTRMIAAILTRHGRRAGSYLSPHLLASTNASASTTAISTRSSWPTRSNARAGRRAGQPRECRR